MTSHNEWFSFGTLEAQDLAVCLLLTYRTVRMGQEKIIINSGRKWMLIPQMKHSICKLLFIKADQQSRNEQKNDGETMHVINAAKYRLDAVMKAWACF